MNKAFSFATTPQLYFGEGKSSMLPSVIRTFGSKVLLVTGARSFTSSSYGQKLLQSLPEQDIQFHQYSVTGEPTPDTVDSAVKRHADFQPDAVVAIGGGSSLDAGKAISAMLPLNSGVKDYLEGVGTLSHPGNKVPFIAVPTTAGTGSEATKNAVISEIGSEGYKRSLRHNNFVPNIAIVDPVLTLGCPAETTAASGMDAFTQLLESYLSTAGNPLSDALALEGLRRIRASLSKAFLDGGNLDARADLSLAAYLSGVTLANAGLGLVHGFASTIGGFFNIPHGVVCSRLMGPSNKITVRKLRRQKSNAEALRKYAIVGNLFSHESIRSDEYHIDFLLDLIESWSQELKIPALSNFGIARSDFQKIASHTDSKNNPIPLDLEEMIEVLESALD